MTLMMVATSALNVKVVQNKRGQTTGVTMTLMMVATSALKVRVVENKRGVNGRSDHDSVISVQCSEFQRG